MMIFIVDLSVGILVTHHSRSWIWNTALIWSPLIVWTFFMSKWSVKHLPDVSHAIDAHCITLEHVTESNTCIQSCIILTRS